MNKTITHTGLVAICTLTGKPFDPTIIFFLPADPSDPSIAAKAWLKKNDPNGRNINSYLPLPNATVTVTHPNITAIQTRMAPYIEAIRTADISNLDNAIENYQKAKKLTVDPIIKDFKSFAENQINLALSSIETSSGCGYPTTSDVEQNIARSKIEFPSVKIDLSPEFTLFEKEGWKEIN